MAGSEAREGLLRLWRWRVARHAPHICREPVVLGPDAPRRERQREHAEVRVDGTDLELLELLCGEAVLRLEPRVGLRRDEVRQDGPAVDGLGSSYQSNER